MEKPVLPFYQDLLLFFGWWCPAKFSDATGHLSELVIVKALHEQIVPWLKKILA
jgi:hypothetical protein